jgi:hypothetical protein
MDANGRVCAFERSQQTGKNMGNQAYFSKAEQGTYQPAGVSQAGADERGDCAAGTGR